jgi:DNA-binding transcriptional regulator LsrR (DeoR family)
MAESKDYFELTREIYTVLVLHFVDGIKQNDIATMLNLSPSKISRLINQGRKLGMLKVAIESPFQHLVDLEKGLVDAAKLASAVVTPTVAGSPVTTLSCSKPCATAISSPSPEARRSARWSRTLSPSASSMSPWCH